MKIVLAPDSFKESMTAKEVCIAMEKRYKKCRYVKIYIFNGRWW